MTLEEIEELQPGDKVNFGEMVQCLAESLIEMKRELEEIRRAVSSMQRNPTGEKY